MVQIKSVLNRTTALGAAATLILAALVPALTAQRAHALALLDRSLMVTSTVESDEVTAPDGSTYSYGSGAGQIPAGDSRNGQKVGHEYMFSVQQTTDLEGFTIEYCTTPFAYVSAPDVACSGPTGFSGSAWAGASITVTNTTTAASQAYTVAAPSANYLELTSSTALVVNPNDVLRIDFDLTGPALNENDYFVNPTVIGTYFAHISTYAQDTEAAAGTPVVDNGTVTNNTTESISIYTRVQETLNFSVEGDEALDGPTAAGGACAPLTVSGDITMGDANDALDAATAYNARSYFRLATNSAYGTVIYFSGKTLESGTNNIDAIANTGAASSPGTEQFGLGVDTGAPGHSLSALTLIGAYDDAATNSYAFDSASFNAPRQIASSTGIVTCETAGVEYVANIATNTPAGIYTTKINYIASPSY